MSETGTERIISLFVRGTDKVIYKYIKYFVPDGQRGKEGGRKLTPSSFLSLSVDKRNFEKQECFIVIK